MLRTIDSDSLTLPESILRLIPPRPVGYPRTKESFPSRAGLTFDPLAAAECSANLTIGLLLHPERAARLEQYHARDESAPGLAEVIDALLSATWRAQRLTGLKGEVQRVVNAVALYHLMALAAAEQAPVPVRATAFGKIRDLKAHLDPADPDQRFAMTVIDQFEKDPSRIPLPRPADPPPGQPI